MKKIFILLITFLSINANAGTLNIPCASSNPQLRFVNCKSWDLCTLDEAFIAMLTQAFSPLNIVETGTFKGDTIDRFRKYVPFKYTIELSQELFDGVKKRFENDRTVYPFHGDSAQVLPTIIQRLQGKTLFFLDAHFSGNGTAKGPENTPILTELQLIKAGGITEAILVIDDIRMFYEPVGSVKGSIMEGYPSLLEIVNKILEINPEYMFAIIADDLVAFTDHTVTVSEVTRAATISRLSDGSNFSKEEILAAEKVIAKAQGIERTTIQRLAEYCTEGWSKDAGLSRHYPFWYGLILQNEGNNVKASQFFREAKERGLNHCYNTSTLALTLSTPQALPTMNFMQIN